MPSSSPLSLSVIVSDPLTFDDEEVQIYPNDLFSYNYQHHTFHQGDHSMPDLGLTDELSIVMHELESINLKVRVRGTVGTYEDFQDSSDHQFSIVHYAGHVLDDSFVLEVPCLPFFHNPSFPPFIFAIHHFRQIGRKWRV